MLVFRCGHERHQAADALVHVKAEPNHRPHVLAERHEAALIEADIVDLCGVLRDAEAANRHDSDDDHAEAKDVADLEEFYLAHPGQRAEHGEHNCSEVFDLDILVA